MKCSAATNLVCSFVALAIFKLDLDQHWSFYLTELWWFMCPIHGRTFLKWTKSHFDFERVCETDPCVSVSLGSLWRFKGESEMSQTGLSFLISAVSQWGLSEVTVPSPHWNIFFRCISLFVWVFVVSTDCNQCLVTYVISVAECRDIQCSFFCEWGTFSTDAEQADSSGCYLC